MSAIRIRSFFNCHEYFSFLWMTWNKRIGCRTKTLLFGFVAVRLSSLCSSFFKAHHYLELQFFMPLEEKRQKSRGKKMS